MKSRADQPSALRAASYVCFYSMLCFYRRANMNHSDQVREFVKEHYVVPARRTGAGTVSVRVGEVHRAMKWDLKRVPQVCSALSTRKFLNSANVELIERKGPPSGQSTTVEFTLRLLKPESGAHEEPPEAKPVAKGDGLRALYGIFAEEFKALGGGEAFLKAERDWGPDVWERYAMETQAAAENRK